MKKSISILLTLSMLLSISLTISSCRKNSDESPDEANGVQSGADNRAIGGELMTLAPDEHFDVVARNIKIGQIHHFSRVGDKMYLIGGGTDMEQPPNVFENEDGTVMEFYPPHLCALTFDMQGNLLSEVYLSDENGYNVFGSVSAVDKDGNIFSLAESFSHVSEATGRPSLGEIKLQRFNSEGILEETIELTGLPGNMPFSDFGATLLIGDDGTFYFLSGQSGTLIAFERSGEVLFSIGGDENVKLRNITKTREGMIVAEMRATVDNAVRFEFMEIDPQMMGYGRIWSYSVPADGHWLTFSSGNRDYDLLELCSTGISGYNLESQTRTPLVDWSNWKEDNIVHGMGPFRFVVMTDDGYFFSLLHEFPEGTPAGSWTINATSNLIKIKQGTSAALDAPSDRIVINAAALNNEGHFIKSVIAQFNSQSDMYYIDLKTYTQGKMELETYQNALASFNIDIIAGNIPDIIFLDSFMPVKSYISKGLFADLYEFIDADPVLSREDYLPNILKLLETDGKLYTAAASFQINVLTGKTSEVGAGPGWTWEDYHALMASKPAGTIPIADEYAALSKATYLGLSLSIIIDNYVDFETGRAFFDSPDFIKLLETANNYPAEQIRHVFEPQDFRDGNPVLIQIWLAGFSAWQTNKYENFFGEEFSYIGYPTEDGSNRGYSAWFIDTLAISKNAAQKDGAWEFMKYVLTDFQYTSSAEDRDVNSIAGFPIKRSALELLAERELERDGEWGVLIDSNGFEIRNLEQKDIQEVFGLINTVEMSASSDQTMSSIINEEAAYFFSGMKTAEQVAKIIQDRVSIYLAEML